MEIKTIDGKDYYNPCPCCANDCKTSSILIPTRTRVYEVCEKYTSRRKPIKYGKNWYIGNIRVMLRNLVRKIMNCDEGKDIMVDKWTEGIYRLFVPPICPLCKNPMGCVEGSWTCFTPWWECGINSMFREELKKIGIIEKSYPNLEY